jgi:hypothetical protein
MKKLSLHTGVLAVLLLSACAQPGFDKNRKVLKFAMDKQYYIPMEVSYNSRPIPDGYLSILRSVGMDCRKDDLVWMAYDVREEMNYYAQNNGKEIIRKAYLTGEAGCAHPLSDQEYQYRINQQSR